MDMAFLLQDFVYWYSPDPLVAIVTRFVVCYADSAVAFHAQYHLR